ncbi:WD repeat-containing protein jip5 [Tulasnella sp. 403]|nr:WD repeat-containing protein jip5 [Tulasnella sp. 403]
MPDIALKSQCFDLAFSPTQDHLYAGLLTGEVTAFAYDDSGSCTELFSVRPTKRSCRGVAVDADGRRLFTVSKAKTLHTIDPLTGLIVNEKLGAHESPINRVAVCTANVVATGDDEGVVKLWDPRKPTEIRAFTRHYDFISDFIFFEDKHHLVSTSGDGSLTVMDIRGSKLQPLAQSEEEDDEYLSVCAVKMQSKLVVGTQVGTLSIFNRSTAASYRSPVDRMPGHPASVDALVALTDDIIATGSSDGLVRLVQVMPNRLLGVVADHDDMPVERLAVSRNGNWLGSASHDDSLKLTDIADVSKESDDEADDVSSMLHQEEDVSGEGAEMDTDDDGSQWEGLSPLEPSQPVQSLQSDHGDKRSAAPDGPTALKRVRRTSGGSEDEPEGTKRKGRRKLQAKNQAEASDQVSFFADL